jgi:hypothetical protein
MDRPNNLILRPTVIGGARLLDDFTVLFEGRRVGRIRLAPGRIGQPSNWEWVVNPPLPVPSWCAGSERDFGKAKAAFREAWAHLYAGLTPEEIARWHAIDRID